ncbi:hypothetical protein HYV86_05300 [Candidatus Woesearchaeota archaeon]|nr:hypothetical protein [Candidatus Woesearchaeota archaeon]
MGFFSRDDLKGAVKKFELGKLQEGVDVLQKQMGKAGEIHDDLAGLQDLMRQYEGKLVEIKQCETKYRFPQRVGPRMMPVARANNKAVIAELHRLEKEELSLRQKIRALTRKLYLDERGIQ